MAPIRCRNRSWVQGNDLEYESNALGIEAIVRVRRVRPAYIEAAGVSEIYAPEFKQADEFLGDEPIVKP